MLDASEWSDTGPRKELKYIEIAFTSDGKQGDELDTRMGKASAVMRALHYSVIMK